MAKTENKPNLESPSFRPRFVTAASLFDGHDAAINIMRESYSRRGPR